MSEHVKEILVPIDGSENSIRAVKFGLEMADAMSVGLRLFYVFPAASVEIIGMAGMSRDDIDQAAQASAQRAFDKIREELGETSVKIDEETSIGDPAEEIIRYTEDDHSVLVIMGRRGLSRMQTLLMGSVSDKVSRHAKSPITIVT